MHEERLLEIIKKAAVEAVEAAKPVSVVFGRVTAASPLTVRVDQKLTLSGDMLAVCAGIEPLPGHVREGLKAGDRVLLLRMQGGQKYVVLDKVVM